MRLVELEPKFVSYVVGVAHEGHGRNLPDGTIQWGGFPCEEIHTVDSIAEAQGIWFLCPKCFEANAGRVGTHSVEVTFSGKGATDVQGSHNLAGQPSRWGMSGTCFDDLVLTPSILLAGSRCGWHGFVGSNGAPPGGVISV